jgi:hypothetical protein
VSTSNHTTPEDRPEYTTGDIVEVFNPKSNSYQWIEVDEVIQVNGSQILVANGSYFCSCWVRTESLATPGRKERA